MATMNPVVMVVSEVRGCGDSSACPDIRRSAYEPKEVVSNVTPVAKMKPFREVKKRSIEICMELMHGKNEGTIYESQGMLFLLRTKIY